MSKKLFKYEIIGFVFVSVLGTIAHFIYEWSSYNIIAGLLCPVNESTWEHLKLIFLPYLIWSIIQCFLSGKEKGYIAAKFVGVTAGMVTITAFYYTYTGIIGKNIDFLNVLSFFLGVLVAFFIDYVLIKSNRLKSTAWNVLAVVGFIIISILFLLFTIAPPFIPFFRDPINLNYGL